jgi:hypothetical protein
MRLDLKQSVFEAIQQLCGPFAVDLFATRLTRKLRRLFSWIPDPEAEAVDAFSLDWNHLSPSYAHPRSLALPESRSTLSSNSGSGLSNTGHSNMVPDSVANADRLPNSAPNLQEMPTPTTPEIVQSDPHINPSITSWLVSEQSFRTQAFRAQLLDC